MKKNAVPHHVPKCNNLDSMVIGIDFDNTLVNYDDVLLKTAKRLGFIKDGLPWHKKNIRDAIRQLPDGEKKWQQLQAHVYGKAMEEAVLIEGVIEFFQMCHRAGVPVYIVSHKTQFAAQDTDKIDLRQTALNWMKQKGFFDSKGLGFSSDRVFFEATRQDKVGRIKHLGCTHFIDDLEETFLEKSFPEDTVKILYSSQRDVPYSADMTVMYDWRAIYDHFFNRGR